MKKAHILYSLSILIVLIVAWSSYKELTKSLSDKLARPTIIDYWTIGSTDLQALEKYPDFVSVINLAFPTLDGRGNIAWTHKDPAIYNEKVKELIQLFKRKKKRVLVSIGGADETQWNLDKIDLDNFCNNIKNFLEQYQLDGVDIDYELSSHRDKLTIFIKKLRNVLPKEKYLLTYASFAIGAYGIKGHEHNELNNAPLKGIDIAVLGVVKDQIDWVNVMAYNAFFSEIQPPYNPIEALLSFKELMGSKDKVVLGLMIGRQDYPKGLIISSQTAMPWVEFVIKEKFRGLMFFELSRDVEENTNEPTGTFSKMIENVLNQSHNPPE